MQQLPKPNAFTQPRRASIAIELQRKAINSHVPNAQQQIVIYPQADAIKRQRIRLANI